MSYISEIQEADAAHFARLRGEASRVALDDAIRTLHAERGPLMTQLAHGNHQNEERARILGEIIATIQAARRIAAYLPEVKG